MPVERVANGPGRVELWAFDWDETASPVAKLNRQFLGYEQPVNHSRNASSAPNKMICWSYGRTLGNVAVYNDEIIGSLSANHGEDCVLGCDIVEAGKMRNGMKRWWCRIHQQHWGTNADIERARRDRVIQCANHLQPTSYVINPPSIRVEDYAEIGVQCLMAPPLTEGEAKQHPHPKIAVRTRIEASSKTVNQIYDAIALVYTVVGDLFAYTEFSTVHVTPPVALEFALGLERGLNMGCVNCHYCGHPHLDLGAFGRTAHVKHLCGNCGRDSTWSSSPIVSTPLKPLHDHFNRADEFCDSKEVLNIDDYPGARFAMRPSMPALIWTCDERQPRGIYVHLVSKDEITIDDVFGAVILRGETLFRSSLLRLAVPD